MTDNPVPAKAGIVERLRMVKYADLMPQGLLREAADKIERLRAERDALQAEVKRLTHELPSAD
jgi:uncharacterized protein (UPF0335 family)